MNEEFWNSVISTVTLSEPADLDSDINQFSAKLSSCAVRGKTLACKNKNVLSGVLWPVDNPDGAFIGVRVKQPIDQCYWKAIQLASIAIDRKVTPIILTTLGESGFEKFGFRVERLAGETNDELLVSEQELKLFWNLAAVIDAHELK